MYNLGRLPAVREHEQGPSFGPTQNIRRFHLYSNTAKTQYQRIKLRWLTELNSEGIPILFMPSVLVTSMYKTVAS